ncbi:hypothetical protein N9J01_00480 [bacterium]|nr:hypothetical protein [bacterium]
MNNDKFLGHNGFLWFVGVVEDRGDPQYAGRVRVRCLGHHTSNNEILPTSDLPWAQVVLPITSSGISGLGQTPLGLVEGSWVFGYFRDGSNRQEPLVIGSLPGRPSEYGNPNKGFYDPNERENDTTKSVYPREIDEPDVNRLAVNNPDKQHSSLTTRTAERLTNITGVNNTWNQPEISYKASYPYNHVYESESGHIMEFDDTTDAKRIHLRHTSGTSIEMTNNGDTIEITKNNRYILVTADNKVYIKGTKDVVIDGDYDLKVNGDYNISVGGNKTETIEGTKTSNTTGAVVHTGSTIDLNP